MGFLMGPPPSQSIVLQARLTGLYGHAPPLCAILTSISHVPTPTCSPQGNLVPEGEKKVLILLEHNAVVPWSVKSYSFMVKQTS